MIAKKRLLPILVAVLMVFVMMPMTAYAEDGDAPERTVIIDPGAIGGEPITVKSTDDGMLAPTISAQGNGMFQWDNPRMWYRYPDLPATFEVPDGLVFTGWTSTVDSMMEKPGYSIVVDDTTTVTAQFKYNKTPEMTYPFVIGFTGSSDGNINGACAYWKPIDDADGYAVRLIKEDREGYTEAGGIIDVNAIYSSYGDNYSANILNDAFIDEEGFFTAEVYAFRTFNGIKFYSDPLKSEKRSISMINIRKDEDAESIAKIFTGKTSDDGGANITAQIRDYWASQFLTGDGRYVNEQGDELVAVMPWPTDVYGKLIQAPLSSYSTYQEMISNAWFLPDGSADAGTIEEASTVNCYPVWKSDLSVFCDKVGHTWEQKIQKATPTSDGRIYQLCSLCGTEETITPLLKVSNIKLTGTSYTYTGKAIKPKVTVANASEALAADQFTVAYSKNTNAGTATAKVTLKGDYYEGTKSLTFTINKAANPLKVSAKTATVKYSKLKKKHRRWQSPR